MSQHNMPLGRLTTHKHLGDLTAKATVEWVLLKLSSANDLREVVEDLPEDLCEALNTTRLIDLLRPLVKERSAFESIERIAEELAEREEWRNYPRLSVLLLSIARECLEELSYVSDNGVKSYEGVKKTNLYRVGERIYHYFMEQPDTYDTYDRCVYVLKAGFQLFHYDQDEEWHREFKEFQALYDNLLVELQVYYYFGDNFAELSDQAKTGRGQKRIIDSISQSSKYPNKELKELNPQRLEFPILARSTEALKFASRFTQDLDLENDEVEENAKKMAQEFRILQWEILVRNLVEEDRDHEFRFYLYRDTVDYNIPGSPKEDFLISFVDRARMAECRSIPLRKQILMEESDDEGSDDTETLKKKINRSYESFKGLLSKVPDFVREDYVHSFVNMRNEDLSLNVMLVRDSELSFFSLIWLLRFATSGGEQVKDWKLNPEDKRKVCFRPGDAKSSDKWWSSCDMYEFAEECGLIIRLRNSECMLTRRWRSLTAWLRQLNTDLEKAYKNDEKALQAAEKEKILSHNNPLLQRLPLKRLNYDKDIELSFIKDLWEFLVSDPLKALLEKLDNLPETAMSCNEFANKGLGPLLESFDSLLKVESSAGLEDVLLHCCRGFIPLEHLFRAYQPYEIHLLVQALNWERSFLVDGEPAPISLGFASIAGSVPYENLSDSGSSQNETTAFDQWLVPYRSLLSFLSSDSGSSQNETAAFDQWLVPYRSLFSALSADSVLPALQDASKQIGKRDQKRSFAHQTSGLIGTIWSDPQTEKLSFLSQFSLWLAKVHVQEIWGDIPMHPERAIYERDFPRWEKDDIEIVNRLVNLGVWGGIIRAAAPPISNNLENAPKGNRLNRRRLSRYARKLHLILEDPNSEMEMIDQVIENELKSLSFHHLPEHTLPPLWVTGRAFAICFYHGIRQAAYHALKTFVLIDEEQKNPEKPCLWTEWTDKQVLIYNRGEIEIEKHPLVSIKDREFFERFENKALTEKGTKMFKIIGPKPVAPGKWCLEINKVVSDA